MRQFNCPKAFTHPSTNRARCRATALIETDALPLHQTANPSKALYTVRIQLKPQIPFKNYNTVDCECIVERPQTFCCCLKNTSIAVEIRRQLFGCRALTRKHTEAKS